MNKFLTIIVLTGLVLFSGCATKKIICESSNFNPEISSFETDENDLAILTEVFPKIFQNEKYPNLKIRYCEDTITLIKYFENKYTKRLRLKKQLELRQMTKELEEMIAIITEELFKFETEENYTLKTARKNYVKNKTITDLKFINNCVKKEQEKYFNWFGVRIDLKNVSKAWSFCDRINEEKLVPEMLKVKAADFMVEIKELLRKEQENICISYIKYKNYSEYKDYPDWDTKKAALERYIRKDDDQNIEMSEISQNKSIDVVSNN